MFSGEKAMEEKIYGNGDAEVKGTGSKGMREVAIPIQD